MVLKGFDITQEAGAAGQMIDKEIDGVIADRELTITFAAKKGQAAICGVEILAE